MRNRNLKYRFTSRSRTACLLTMFLLMLPTMSCSPRGDESFGRSSSAQATSTERSSGTRRGDNNEAVSAASAGRESENPDRGDFQPLYSDVQNPKYVELNEKMKQQRVLEKIADAFNQELSLPFDVSITFRDCGQPNAFYTAKNKTITMCYEFMELFYQIFAKKGNSDADSTQLMLGATNFFFLHELGHCLIDVYDLPATGREEDSVDQLSTYILVRDKKESDYASVMAGIVVFKALAENEESSASVFADEHSLSSQRYYNLACWMYGSDPQAFSFLVQQGILPEARAARCSEEYEKMSRAWQRLVDPWIKK